MTTASSKATTVIVVKDLIAELAKDLAGKGVKVEGLK